MRTSLIAVVIGSFGVLLPFDLPQTLFSSAAYISVMSASAGTMFDMPLFAASSTITKNPLFTMALLDPASKYPHTLVIPSIHLSTSIAGMGVNKQGEMDVPNGSTNTVGWYKYGTIPGQRGSAVLDAHVYAAFEKIGNLRPGNDIYVVNASNQTLHFVVQEVKKYRLKDLSAQALFNRADDKRLNLITCAGTFVPVLGTYDHRIVVYATLAEDAA